MVKTELRNNKLKNHKNTLGVKAKGSLCKIKGLIKTFLNPGLLLFLWGTSAMRSF